MSDVPLTVITSKHRTFISCTAHSGAWAFTVTDDEGRLIDASLFSFDCERDAVMRALLLHPCAAYVGIG